MGTYDVLRDTWIYQEIKQEVLAEFSTEFLREQRRLLLEIIQARFPRILPLAQSSTDQITDPAHLRHLIVTLSTVRMEKEARQAFALLQNEASKQEE